MECSPYCATVLFFAVDNSDKPITEVVNKEAIQVAAFEDTVVNIERATHTDAVFPQKFQNLPDFLLVYLFINEPCTISVFNLKSFIPRKQVGFI